MAEGAKPAGDLLGTHVFGPASLHETPVGAMPDEAAYLAWDLRKS